MRLESARFLPIGDHMRKFNSSSFLSQVCGLAVLAFSVAASLQAQTQANCTFTYFDPPSGYIYGFYPNGINHYNTVVGGVFGPNQNTEKAFIRYSGGGMSLFGFPNATWTYLNRRNVYGTSVGAYGASSAAPPPGLGSHGLIYTSKSYATLNYPGSPSTALTGINKSNTIVGNETDPTTKHVRGFKYVNGKFTQIKYPGSVQTTVTGINDNGVIVGGYEDGSSENPWNGYILQNGTFKSLKYIPNDINNSGTIVSGSQIHYANGTVKTVYVPGSANTFVNGINDLGIITGGASWGTFEFKGFTATCK
jgi:hypothetical protein